MSYNSDKELVIGFFETHILKYIVTDLKVLNDITANSNGEGGCAIPQAISAFSAIDLIGYLTSAQNVSPIRMHFTEILKNANYFPEIKDLAHHEDFFNSFRDDIRSVMAHRFSLVKYDIEKSKVDILLTNRNGDTVFNVSYFTKLVIKSIETIFDSIKNDSFIIDGVSAGDSVKKVKDKIIELKQFESKYYTQTTEIVINTTCTETTKSIS